MDLNYWLKYAEKTADQQISMLELTKLRRKQIKLQNTLRDLDKNYEDHPDTVKLMEALADTEERMVHLINEIVLQ